MVGETNQCEDVATSERVTESIHTWCGSGSAPEWQRVRAGAGGVLQGGGTKVKVSEWRRRVSTGVRGQRLLVERLAQLKTSASAPCLGTSTRRASVPLGPCGTRGVGTQAHTQVRSKPAEAFKSTDGQQGASTLRGAMDTHTHSHTHTNTRTKVSVDKPWRSKSTAVIKPWVGPRGDVTSSGSTLPPIQGSSVIPPHTNGPNTQTTPRSSLDLGKVRHPQNGTPKACVVSTATPKMAVLSTGTPKVYVPSTGTPRPHRKLSRTQEVGGQMSDVREACRRSSAIVLNEGRKPLELVAPRRVSACWNWRPDESHAVTHSQTHNQTCTTTHTQTYNQTRTATHTTIHPAPPPVPPSRPPPASASATAPHHGSAASHSTPLPPSVSHPAEPQCSPPSSSSHHHPPRPTPVGSKTPASPEDHLQYPGNPDGGDNESKVTPGQVSSPGKLGAVTEGQVRSATAPYRTRAQVQRCSHDSAIETDSHSAGSSGSDDDDGNKKDGDKEEEEEDYYTDERIGEWVVKVNACLFSPSDSGISFDSQLEEEDVDTIKIIYGQD